jgi:hypothetical protein
VGKRWKLGLVLGLAFIVAFGATFVFAYRAGRRARRLRAESDPIRAWMSVPFVAHSHHVPAAALFAAIGVQPRQPHDRRSIRHLARDLNRQVPDLIAQLERAIDAAQKPPGGPSK